MTDTTKDKNNMDWQFLYDQGIVFLDELLDAGFIPRSNKYCCVVLDYIYRKKHKSITVTLSSDDYQAFKSEFNRRKKLPEKYSIPADFMDDDDDPENDELIDREEETILKKVFITFSFRAYHAWSDAPKSCKFLRHKHRHVFHVRMEFLVFHNDRDIEFITKKDEILEYVNKVYDNKNLGSTSCEMIAEVLLNKFDACRVEVSEDGENGAILELQK